MHSVKICARGLVGDLRSVTDWFPPKLRRRIHGRNAARVASLMMELRDCQRGDASAEVDALHITRPYGSGS